jgi:shikimate 5-dehydrogenase
MQYGIEQGAQTISGLDMLHAQAESAWQIWNE